MRQARGAAALQRLLSRDLPRSRALTGLLALVLVALLLAPVAGHDGAALDLAAQALLAILLVASYDLLLGYAGLWSFAHPLHLAIGLQGVGLATARLGPGWGAALLGGAAALLVSLGLALLMSLLTEALGRRWRVGYAAALSLVLAWAVQALAAPWLAPAVAADATRVVSGHRPAAYALLFAAVLLLWLVLLRSVNSPFGRVVVAVRENAFRAEALGYRAAVYRTLSQLLAALFACAAGVMAALWWRHAPPAFGFNGVLIDTLLLAAAVIIGGRGTVYGAVLAGPGAVLAATALQHGLAWAAPHGPGVPVLSMLLAPAAWPAWLALPMALMVFHFPAGVVDWLRTGRRTRARKAWIDNPRGDEE